MNIIQKEKTIFEKIIDGEIPSVKIYEDDVCIAIMDKFPDTKGKSLVIPKKPVDYTFDLDDETYLHIMKITKKVVRAIDQALSPVRTCILIEGFEVPHSHIKICPVYERHFVNQSGPEAPDKDLEIIAKQIKEKLD